MRLERDHRTWSDTDRPGERFSISRPALGVEVMSVRGSHRHWREAHDSFTLAVVHVGQQPLIADWHTRGRSLSTERGGIMAIEPGETHVTQRLSARAGAADFDIVRLSPALIEEAARKAGLRGAFHFKTPSTNDAPAFAALQALVAATASGDTFEVECATAHAMSVMMSRLAESAGLSSLQPVRDYRLRKVKDYLCAHLERRPSLAELEAVSDLSRYHLCGIFKDAYGMSLGHYGSALRLAEAVRRLQRGTPIKQIVGELGYADEPYFSRLFKRHYGVAPGAWLSLLRKNDARAPTKPAR